MNVFIDVETLKNLAQRALSTAQGCHCQRRDLEGWADWPVSFHEHDFAEVGTLARYAPEESIIKEFHPAGTSYWSSNAPIAPRFYPYNQSTVWQCRSCERVYLRHNDDGAYHVALRIRLVSPMFIMDAPHPNDGRECAGM